MAKFIKTPDSKEDFYENLFENQINTFVEKHKVTKKLGDDLNIFKMAYQLENRYAYIMKTAKERSASEIKNVQKYNHELRDMIINERKKKIQDRMTDLKKDIENSLEEHNKIEKEEEIKMNNLYYEKKEKLIENILKKINLSFL